MGFLSKLFGFATLTSASYYIEKVFNERIEASMMRSFFLFGVFLFALVIGRLSFINERFMMFVSSSILLILFVYSCFKIVKIITYIFTYFVKKFSSLIQFNASLKDLILDFLIYKYDGYFKAYDFFTKYLNNKYELFLPSSNEAYEHLHKYLWRNMIIKISYYIGATLVVSLILKPGASYYLSDVKIYYLYFTPFTLSIDYLFNTNYTDFFVSN